MDGRGGGTPSNYDFYSTLIDRGVPRYAAGKALRAKMRRDAAKRATPKIGPGTHPRHHTDGFCGSCYERSKGR